MFIDFEQCNPTARFGRADNQVGEVSTQDHVRSSNREASMWVSTSYKHRTPDGVKTECFVPYRLAIGG